MGPGSNSNFSGILNHYAVTPVCGVGDEGKRGRGIGASFQRGSNLWVCAPLNALTTSHNNLYKEVSGTSPATAIVSGVVALVRDANRDLSWRDVKLILAGSARQNDPDDPEWATGSVKYGSTSDRYVYNEKYGFGVVDAGAAVSQAKTWTNLPLMEINSAESGVLELTVPDPAEGAEPTTVSHSLTLGPETGFIEFAEVNIEFNHPSLRDLGVEIVSPSGTVSMLTESDANISDAEFRDTFRFGSAKHLGEDPTGTWTLRLTDHVPGQQGSIKGWSLKVYGHGAGTAQTHIPNIVGEARVGETLTADVTTISEVLTNVQFSYQWVMSDGDAYTNIQDATESTYTLVADDEAKDILREFIQRHPDEWSRDIGRR